MNSDPQETNVTPAPTGLTVQQRDGVPILRGMEIDPDLATDEYRERILAPMRAFMPIDQR